VSETAALELEGGARARFHYRAPSAGSTVAVLMPGLFTRAVEALEADRPDELTAALARLLHEEGFGILGVEVEGARTDVVTEVEAHVSAAAAIDLDRAVVVAHSLGAMLAPLFAAAKKTRGVVTIGAPARRWADALAEAARRQLSLGGLKGKALEREVVAAKALYTSVLRQGGDLATLPPEITASVAARELAKETLHGVPLPYLRSLDAVEPGRSWLAAGTEVIAVQGEFDFVVGEGDHNTIAALVTASLQPAQAVTLGGVDHALAAHNEMAGAFRKRGGPVSLDAVHEIVAMIAHWRR
jgi:pimeloyl-ACP methyl ester carboxylesterase